MPKIVKSTNLSEWAKYLLGMESEVKQQNPVSSTAAKSGFMCNLEMGNEYVTEQVVSNIVVFQRFLSDPDF